MKKYGRYEIVDEIGQGTMGIVYRAYDPQINRQIALKILHENRVTDEEFALRFLREGQAMGVLSHPNIAIVFDMGWDQNKIFIAMELLKGKSLEDVMRDKKLNHQEIAQIGVQVAEALDFTHRKGIVHRDIKPSNIIIDPNGLVKITDFGIAHIEDPAMTRQTSPGEILGTPLYMSPEQVEGKPVDGRSDLYSLGVILYELTTGTNATKGESLYAIYKSILRDTPPAPKLNDTPTSRSLSNLIMKSLSKDPNKRFQTGSEMAQSLKACLQRREAYPRQQLNANDSLNKKGWWQRFFPNQQKKDKTSTTEYEDLEIFNTIRIKQLHDETPPEDFFNTEAFTGTNFFKNDTILYSKIEQSLSFYRDHLNQEYESLKNQANAVYRLWIGCVVLGFLMLLVTIATMLYGDLNQKVGAIVSTIIVYFIHRIFTQREDHYRNLAKKKYRHLEYGNHWLIAIQSIDSIQDLELKKERQSKLAQALIDRLKRSD